MQVVVATFEKPSLLDQLREQIRVRHYSIRTEQAYVDWCRRFILWHGKRHPRDIRTVQELLGHKDVQTTMIYTHVLNRGGKGVRRPLDQL